MAWGWRRGDGPRNGEAFLNRKQYGGWGLVGLYGQGEASWSGRDYGSLCREGFMRNPVAHRGVKMIAEAAASIPWIVYEGEAELEDHPVLELLNRPNQRQAGPSFMEMLYGHLVMSGNAYVEMVQGPNGTVELHLLRPDCVTIVADESGWPVALEHRVGASRRRIRLEEPPAAMHVRLFHPLDDHYGYAPLSAATQALDIHNAAARWNKALLDNSARPSGALVYAPKEGGNLTDEQFERLKAELEQGYAGSSRAGRPLLLEGGLDWKAMSLTPRDMDFMEAKNGAARDIALALGVPPMLLGIPGDNTYANYQEANRAFYRLTVLPLVGRMVKEFEAFLTRRMGGGFRLAYDADQVEGLAAEREALWARIGNATFLTDDEKRAAVGYQPRHLNAAGGEHGGSR